MKFLLISPKNRTIYNFRGDLIKEIQKLGYDVCVTGPNKDDYNFVINLGVDFYEIPSNKSGTSIISDLRYYKRIKSLINSLKPDVVFSYTVKPSIYGTLAAKRCGVNNVYCMITGAGYAFTSTSLKAKLINFVVKILYKKSLRKANGVIFQNHDDLEEFVQKKLVIREKVHVVNGSGVNLTKYMFNEYPKQITFLMVSRLLKSKGVIEYLEAARIVKKIYPNVRFVLLGKYETSMNDKVDKELVEKFIASGVVERFDETNNVLDFYNISSIYVLPSYREGVPRTVLEAMACHRPIITTDTNGCRETVINGFNGFLVPVKDVGSLSDKMIEFIKNPCLINEMGENSFNLCKKKFDVKLVNNEMIRIMELKEKRQ